MSALDSTLETGLRQAWRILPRLYLLVWLLLPNFVLLGVYNDALPPQPQFALVLAVSLLIYGFVFPSLRLFALVNLPFALFSGAYAGYIFFYKSIPYEGMWFSIWDMVYLEIVDLGSYYLDLIILNLVGFGLYLAAALSLKSNPAKSGAPAYRKPFLLAGVLGALTLVLAQNFLHDRVAFGKQSLDSSFIQTYPLGMLVQLYTTWAESKRHESFEYETLPPLQRVGPPLAGREIYVLVVGETSRGDRFLADLERHDYRHLESGNSVIFGDAYSQANFTDGSLHLLMTGASTYEESRQSATLPLIARAGGCQTIWISNNKAYRYAWQADYSVITEQTTSTPLINRFDHTMLPSIHRALEQGDKRLCLIVHLLGSHFDYHKRYPREFMRRPVDMEAYDNKSSAEHVAALRNAYDNSIHATNDLLDQIIDYVQQQDATGVVIYTADHGENLYDDERNLFQHIMSVPSKYEIAVPFMIWANDRFIEQAPDKWAALVANSTRPVSNRQILPTFIDLLGVDYLRPHFSPSLMTSYREDPRRFVLAPDLRLLSADTLE